MRFQNYPYSLRSVRADGVNFIVTGLPATLVGGPFPTRLWPNWSLLAHQGFSHVVCLASTEPETRYRPDAGNFSWLAKVSLKSPGEILDAVCHPPNGRLFPVTPNALDELMAIARQVLSVSWARQGVCVHCEYGIERTSLLIGTILILTGADPDETTRRFCIVHSEMGAASPQLATDLRSLFWKVALSK